MKVEIDDLMQLVLEGVLKGTLGFDGKGILAVRESGREGRNPVSILEAAVN